MRGSFAMTMQSRWCSMLGAYAYACFRMCVRVRVLVLVFRVWNADVATDVLSVLGSYIHSRALLKKKWSEARAAWNFRISRAR